MSSHSTYKITFSQAALEDIKSIENYTYREWGKRQGDIYHNLLCEAFNTIEKQPQLGRPRKGISRKFKCYNVGKHVIVYTLTQQDIFVVRVLHGKMHFSQQLA
jgi:toxin ParE1/3/4